MQRQDHLSRTCVPAQDQPFPTDNDFRDGVEAEDEETLFRIEVEEIEDEDEDADDADYSDHGEPRQ